jgi:Ca-activated chloride channel family protein
MTRFGFHTPSAAWLLFLAIPIVILYFLKLKRQRVIVPSLVLWQQVIQDSRVNSPFQKFKRHLLLILQLILLLLLAIAAMQPYWRGVETDTERVLILVDRSSSMGAIGKETQKSRLDLVKEQVHQMIDEIGPGQEIGIIAFSESAQQAIGFDSNKRLLREALDKIAIHDVPSNLTAVVRMAEAMGRTTAFDKVLLMSDGNIPPDTDFQLPYELEYLQIPAAGVNVGITDVTAQRNGASGWAVFVGLHSSGDVGMPIELLILRNGVIIGMERVVLRSDGTGRVIIPIETETETIVELRLKIGGFDSLAADNVAYLKLVPARPLEVSVSAVRSLRRALEVQKGIQLRTGASTAGVNVRHDLVVSDTDGSDAPTTLTVGSVPEDLRHLIKIYSEQTTVVDWRRSSSLLEHVRLGELVIMQSPKYVQGAKIDDLEDLHYEVLADGKDGPLIIKRHRGASLSYHLLFDPDQSTLPYRIGLPIMVSNLLRVARHRVGLSEAYGSRTGLLKSPKGLTPNATYLVRGPDELTRTEIAGADGVLSGIPAPRAGWYTFELDGKEVARIGASVLDVRETTLASVQKIGFEELSVSASEGTIQTNRQLWPIMAFLALMLLVCEWWYFNRRSGVLTS